MEVRQDYESEVRVNPCLCRWAIICGVSVFFKGKWKLQREQANTEWVILLIRDNQKKSALEQILPRTNPQQILSLLTRVIKRMQMACLYIICYLLLEIGNSIHIQCSPGLEVVIYLRLFMKWTSAPCCVTSINVLSILGPFVYITCCDSHNIIAFFIGKDLFYYNTLSSVSGLLSQWSSFWIIGQLIHHFSLACFSQWKPKNHKPQRCLQNKVGWNSL